MLARSCDRELRHHSSIFVFKDVTVIHEGIGAICRLLKADQDIDSAIYEHGILPARILYAWFLSVFGEHLKPHAMNMKRVHHHV